MKIRCLIPVTQEMKNERALRRAQKICDEIHILYVVDETLFEKMERESAYVLNSDMLDVLKKTLMESQRKEAESIIKEMERKEGVVLHFEVGDYLDVIERYTLMSKPFLIMVDSFDRRLLSLPAALWVDGGNHIRTCTFVLDDAIHISKIKNALSMVEKINKILGSELRIYSKREDVFKAVASKYRRSEKPYADMVVAAKSRHSSIKGRRISLLYLNL